MVIAIGLVLLAICLLIGNALGGAPGMARAAVLFLLRAPHLLPALPSPPPEAPLLLPQAPQIPAKISPVTRRRLTC